MTKDRDDTWRYTETLSLRLECNWDLENYLKQCQVQCDFILQYGTKKYWNGFTVIYGQCHPKLINKRELGINDGIKDIFYTIYQLLIQD